jgi:aspartyl-tRNA(Asn)/glutamyl-tRNA(Gln) amidotransferase subunit C
MQRLDMNRRLCKNFRVNIEDLRETAELAHLNLGEDELKRAYSAFEQMLGYFAAMQAADLDAEAFPQGLTGGADSLEANESSRTVLAGHFRPDGSAEAALREGGLAQAMLEKAGERDGPFVMVPNIL